MAKPVICDRCKKKTDAIVVLWNYTFLDPKAFSAEIRFTDNSGRDVNLCLRCNMELHLELAKRIKKLWKKKKEVS